MKKDKKNRIEESSAISPAAPGQFHTFHVILTCIALPLLLYFPSLRAPFIFDDIGNIVENPRIVSTARLLPGGQSVQRKVELSRPLVFKTFFLNYALGGLNPFGYHLFNVFVHVLNTILIFFFTNKILSYAGHQSFYPALAVALIFSCHPIQTEVVAYASHRTESLAAFFYLSALLLFMTATEGKKILYPISLACFVLSLLSKETAATLPVLLLILDYFFISDLRKEKVAERKSWHFYFWIMLALLALLRYVYTGDFGDPGEHTHRKWSRYTYFITQLFVITRYLKLLFVPMGQSIDHFILPSKTIFESRVILSILILLGLVIFIGFLCKKESALKKIILFSILWFCITIAPTTSFFPIYDAMAERRLYLPSLGFFLFASYVYLRLCNFFVRRGSSSNYHRLLPYLACAYIASLSIATWHRNGLYRSPISIWEDVISQYPSNSRAQYNLGTAYYQDKNFQRAIESYQKAIQLNPKYADAYNNLGTIAFANGEYDRAIELYQRMVELEPDRAIAHYNLGLALARKGILNKAISEYKKTLEIDPNNFPAHNSLGLILARVGNLKEAIAEWEKATELNPADPSVQANLKRARRMLENFLSERMKEMNRHK